MHCVVCVCVCVIYRIIWYQDAMCSHLRAETSVSHFVFHQNITITLHFNTVRLHPMPLLHDHTQTQTHFQYLPYLLLAQGGEAVTLQHLPEEAVGELQGLVLPALAQLRQMLHQEAHHGLLQGGEVEQVGHAVQLQVVHTAQFLHSEYINMQINAHIHCVLTKL